MNLTSFVSHRLHACLARLQARAWPPRGPCAPAQPSAAVCGPQLRAVWQAHPCHGKLQLRLHWHHDDSQDPPGRRGLLARLCARLSPQTFH
ncbi:hypothetical protein [uncultured Pseudomonas sp.]|uniref:hypothetical protein n=1 Tax=uncultured Pseudomonas sp. TaxID=114707 RepID=UPI0025905BDC|nr:hypothetical protein [uncultured Pseudomonas sp.]